MGFIIKTIYNSCLSNRIYSDKQGTVAVLANGPSLKKELPKIMTSNEFKNVDFVVLNYFANQDVFFELRPQHYCFVDPMFFEPTHREKEVANIFNILNEKVDWKINVYIPSNRKKEFLKFSGLDSSFININGVNATSYSGYEKLRNYFYKVGLSMPEPGTVANLAIFISLKKGYNEVRLYGVDHTYFDSICVNNKNELCIKEAHFYNQNVKLKPIIRIDNQKVYSVSDYLHSRLLMFRSHDYLNSYAEYLGVKIINNTEGSMIDSYPRMKNKL